MIDENQLSSAHHILSMTKFKSKQQKQTPNRPRRVLLILNQVELAWLTRCLLPSKVIVDHGNKLFAGFKAMIQANDRIKIRANALRSPLKGKIMDMFNICNTSLHIL